MVKLIWVHIIEMSSALISCIYSIFPIDYADLIKFRYNQQVCLRLTSFIAF